jgi:arsenate reductase (thioredoxin)
LQHPVAVQESDLLEQCPYWPGSPVEVHWGYADPSNAPGGDEGRRAAFELTRQAIGDRMLQLVELPLDTMSDADLQAALASIVRN